MRVKLQFLLIFVVAIIFEITHGKQKNKFKFSLENNKKTITKEKNYISRIKRSPGDNDDNVSSQRDRRLSLSSKSLLNNDDASNPDVIDKEPPFWGTRGRRDSSSMETYIGGHPSTPTGSEIFFDTCKYCSKSNNANFGHLKERRDDSDIPFWGNRGRRNSDEREEDNYLQGPFWGNRGRRYEEDPFWGSRGRREEKVPFWGNRGRRQDLKNQDQPEDYEPFWGSRGRREEIEPFWGSRGRREKLPTFDDDNDESPFWGNRGRRQEIQSFWTSRRSGESKDNRREKLKQVLRETLSAVEDNIENLLRSRRDDNSFWTNRGRSSQLINIFKGFRPRWKLPVPNNMAYDPGLGGQALGARTVLDDRIFAEQPHYIVVERSSRSSAENDPFFISRGKKMFVNPYGISKATRDRRGAIEELVKSVRNDPYYIARGKKAQGNKLGNSTYERNEYSKAKDLICATIEFILNKNNGTVKSKREDTENERDRRTILKKLAAQLQMDPYFVSRGKRSGLTSENLNDFLNEISTKCLTK